MGRARDDARAAARHTAAAEPRRGGRGAPRRRVRLPPLPDPRSRDGRGSLQLHVREGSQDVGPLRSAARQRPDLAPRYRENDRTRLVPRRGAETQARGGGRARRACRGGLCRGPLARARGGTHVADRGGARSARTTDRARARRRRRCARARNQPDGRLHAALPGAQATRGEGERRMTVNEIVDELRGSRPRAGDALRLQVLTLASTPQPVSPTLRERFRDRRRLVLALPAAVAVGVTRPSPAPVASEAIASKATPERSATAPPGSATFAGPAQDAAGAATAKAPAPTTGRAQRYSATLTLGVDDTDALSTATQQALAIARDLGGYAVSVQYATGSSGAASLTLRVPSGQAAAAVTRLSDLGTILAQNVQIDDLQESLDTLDRQLERLRAQVAALTAAIDRADTAAERARLVERRAQAQAQLQELRASRAATAQVAQNATIQLELRTDESSTAPAPGSRLDRALDKALAVLAWEAVVVLALLVAAAPLVLVAVAVWLARRGRRRREEERLLAAS